VNLGSRLEGATKQYRLDVCIGENVAALVRDQFMLRSVDLIVVQGKTRPVEIFTVLGPAGTAEPAWLARHEEAVRLYRAGNFAAAEKAWREVFSQAPGDGVAVTFIDRCLELQKQPPAAPWTGVYEMKSK
jgi:adenylate cyclase